MSQEDRNIVFDPVFFYKVHCLLRMVYATGMYHIVHNTNEKKFCCHPIKLLSETLVSPFCALLKLGWHGRQNTEELHHQLACNSIRVQEKHTSCTSIFTGIYMSKVSPNEDVSVALTLDIAISLLKWTK
jgi:hypothetical protein